MENSSSDPRVFTLATALSETGAGRGSNFGSGAANRSPANAIKRTSPRCFFIADDSRTHRENKPLSVRVKCGYYVMCGPDHCAENFVMAPGRDHRKDMGQPPYPRRLCKPPTQRRLLKRHANCTIPRPDVTIRNCANHAPKIFGERNSPDHDAAVAGSPRS